MSTAYNVLIVGAGNIGAFYDTPNSDAVLTHAHAFSLHKGFKLLGFVDTDLEKAARAAEIWNCSYFNTIGEAFENRVDVVCIAVSDNMHYSVLKQISKFPVKLVFTEKPFTKTLPEAVEISDLYKQRNIAIQINYLRRFVPEFEAIKNNIDAGLYGKYVSGTGYYGKGLSHNGSHMIDILRYFIGEIQQSKTINIINDFYEDDPGVSAVLTFNDNKPFFLQAIDCNLYSICEADLLFEKKRLRIIESGFKIVEYEIKENIVFKGYKSMYEANDYNTSLNKAMLYAAENIYSYFDDNIALKCTAYDGYAALKECLAIGEKKAHE